MSESEKRNIQRKLESMTYNFSMQGNMLNVTYKSWDAGEGPRISERIYDLKTGWLMSFYTRLGNDTNLIEEYEIVNSRKDKWLKEERGLLITFMPVASWVGLLIPVILFYRRREN